jgi:hypothetical protein
MPRLLQLTLSPLSAYARRHSQWQRQHRSMLQLAPRQLRLTLSPFSAHARRHRQWRRSMLRRMVRRGRLTL